MNISRHMDGWVLPWQWHVHIWMSHVLQHLQQGVCPCCWMNGRDAAPESVCICGPRWNWLCHSADAMRAMWCDATPRARGKERERGAERGELGVGLLSSLYICVWERKRENYSEMWYDTMPLPSTCVYAVCSPCWNWVHPDTMLCSALLCDGVRLPIACVCGSALLAGVRNKTKRNQNTRRPSSCRCCHRQRL